MTMSTYVHVACEVLLQSKLRGLIHSHLSITIRDRKNILKDRTTKTLSKGWEAVASKKNYNQNQYLQEMWDACPTSPVSIDFDYNSDA